MVNTVISGNLRRWALVASLTGLMAGQAVSQGFLRADGEKIVDGSGNEFLLKGIGLGGWMLQEPYMLQLSGVAVNQSQIRAKIADLVGEEKTDLFYASWRAHHTTRQDIDSLAAWGFNAIRVPLHFNLFTLPVSKEPVAGQQTWLSTGFELTDSLLSWCKADHIYLILDLHAAPGGQGNDNAISDRDKTQPSLWQSPANREKLVALWQKLAQRYASESWIGGYDLLNETNWGFSDSSDLHGCAEKVNAPLRLLLQQVTAAIRSADTHHLIFIEGNCWANNFRGLLPAWDGNMAISFHKYWNYNDQASIQGVLDLRATYHIPLWLGESGENSNTWTRDAIDLLQANHIGWAWWPLKKAGGNNPLEFHLAAGFRQIVAYWGGKGPRPSPDSAFNALMELAASTAASRNTYHKDVIDAMFRQVHSENTLPFSDEWIHAGARVFAVNYDLGRNGFAYYDKDTGNYKTSTGHYSAWNKGGFYRNDGVDIARCSDSATNGYAVISIEPGEWLQYTVTVTKSGYYKVQYRVEPEPGAVGASWQLLDWSPETLTPTLLDSCSLQPSVAGNNAWYTAGRHKIYLKAGTHRLRFLAETTGFNINYISFD